MEVKLGDEPDLCPLGWYFEKDTNRIYLDKYLTTNHTEEPTGQITVIYRIKLIILGIITLANGTATPPSSAVPLRIRLERDQSNTNHKTLICIL